MSTIFISLIGTQVMGTLQAWGALQRQTPDIEAYLLATNYVWDRAERLKTFANNRGWGAVHLCPVTKDLAVEGNATSVVLDIAKKAEDRRIAFCLDGGLNYMLIACVLALAPFSPILLEATRARMLANDTGSKEYFLWPMAEPLTVEEIFQLQGVEYTLAQPPKNLFDFCKRGEIALPKGTLRGVTIDDITWDFVWNPGNNNLTFMKDCRFPPKEGDERAMKERNIAHWASDRTRCGQLYDRRCEAIVRDSKSEERLTKESDNKLRVKNIRPKASATAEKTVLANGASNADLAEEHAALKKYLLDTFAWKPNTNIQKELKKPKIPKLNPMQDRTLVLVLGRNLESSLVPICSHAPKHLVLCYTDKDPVVDGYRRRIVEKAQDMGIQDVQCVTTSIEGAYLEEVLPKACEGATISVNISPGTKGQGAHLACWARENGYSVWSTNLQESVCSPLFTEYPAAWPIPLRFCDPALLFQLKGLKLRNEGTAADELPDKDFAKHLLRLMRRAVVNGMDTQLFRAPVRIDDMNLKQKSNGLWVLTVKDTEYPFSTKDGEWLEHVTAVAMQQAGARFSRARMRLSWSDENEQDIRKHHGSELGDRDPHRLDLDVVAVHKTKLILVSCKAAIRDQADMRDQIASAAEDVRFTGTSLGRLCLRMLMHMGFTDEPKIENSIMIIGWRELCQPEKLRDCINRLHESQSTLSQSKD